MFVSNLETSWNKKNKQCLNSAAIFVGSWGSPQKNSGKDKCWRGGDGQKMSCKQILGSNNVLLMCVYLAC